MRTLIVHAGHNHHVPATTAPTPTPHKAIAAATVSATAFSLVLITFIACIVVIFGFHLVKRHNGKKKKA
jgi:hypothetical protein